MKHASHITDNLIANPLDKHKHEEQADEHKAPDTQGTRQHDPGDNLITNPLDKPGAKDKLISNPLDKR